MTTLIAVGKIVAPHGVRGDLRVVTLTDFPERFQSLKRIYFDDKSAATVENIKFHQQFVLIKLRECNTRDEAELLRGKYIQIPKEEVMPLPAGHYYLFEILDCKVYTEEGVYLGAVTDIIQTGSNDVYAVTAENDSTRLIPALKEVVRSIDTAGKKIVVKLQEEWES
ncbi:ribosome maturation factor RimM [Acetonema longum]|uniref:Ribosome maturation factor RimM n=1 Tax=Acetonema longum DSM 6540 TaxID=1009370 RepID=F7NFP3_9FIRM|nr:ribosome maturation factor RimM [Acetonema longum]EGO65166.1 16S rRNA processing protein RimM [Acetonema longum DSM 6540]